MSQTKNDHIPQTLPIFTYSNDGSAMMPPAVTQVLDSPTMPESNF